MTPHDLVEAHYATPAAVYEWSQYRLFREEDYLISKYYRAGESVLDLACGAGRTTLVLHEHGLRVVGVDIAAAGVELARRRFPYLDFVRASFTQIPALDASFDHVLVSFNSLDHAYPEEERRQALRECARVLKPGGTLLFSSHNIKSLYGSPMYVYYFPGDTWRLPWLLRNFAKAFCESAYINDAGLAEFYASSEYVIAQTIQQGFQFMEFVGLLASTNWLFNRYCSPYLHYVFMKNS